MAFKEITNIWLLFYSSSINVPLPTDTHLEMTTHTTENPVHAQWYSRKQQVFGSVVQFLKYKCATSYRNTSEDDLPHDRKPFTCTMVFKENTSIRPLLFYSLNVSVPLPTVTHLEMTTHTTENLAHAQ